MSDNNSKENTIDNITKKIFSEPPKPACVASDSDEEIVDVFQKLISFVMDGISIKQNNFEDMQISLFEESLISLIKYVSDYTRSIGYDIKLQRCDSKKTELYTDYYCKIFFRDLNPENFKNNNSDPSKNYTFVLNYFNHAHKTIPACTQWGIIPFDLHGAKKCNSANGECIKNHKIKPIERTKLKHYYAIMSINDYVYVVRFKKIKKI